MSSPRALRSLIVSLLLLVAVPILVLPAPASAASGGTAVTVSLASMSPSIAVKGDTLRLSGKVAGSSAAHDDVIIRLAVADMRVRSDMGTKSGVDSQTVFGHEDDLGPLSPNATAPWSLSMPISALSLNSGTVYALDIEAISGATGDRLGSVRTYLPYAVTANDSSFHATQMVVLWPVTAAPTLDGKSEKDVPEAVNDSLAKQFAHGGRLDKALTTVSAAKGVTVSWAVDPDLLATAYSESHGYSVYPDGASGAGAESAATWLAEAEATLANTGELWQLPATDPDLGSLGHADRTLATETVKAAVAQSATTIAGMTGRSPKGILAWPADGQVDTGTLGLAKVANPAAVIVDSKSVGLHTPQDGYTPTGRAEGNGDNLAISDDALDAIFAGDSADGVYRGSDRTLLAAQRFLAQSALIALERPNLSTPRTVMVTVPRTADPNPALLTAIGQANWIKTVGLSTLLGSGPDREAQTGKPTRAPATAAGDLTQAQLAATGSLSDSLQALSAILTNTDGIVAPYGPAILRTASTAWRSSAAAQGAFTEAVRTRLQTTMNAVTLVQKSDLTLSGKSGVIPFTIENRFAYPVRVGIKITTDRPGLSVQSITVQNVPQGSTTVNVHVSSAVSGTRVNVTAQLVTPGGAGYGLPESLQVTVSSIGSITLVIFGLSAALLVVAVVLRIYRGRRTRTGQPEPDPLGESAENLAAAEAEREQ